MPCTVMRNRVQPAIKVPRPHSASPDGVPEWTCSANAACGSGFFQDARRQHGLCAGKSLLIRLEHQTDGSLQFLPVLLQQPGRSQQHGGVKVVAAGVHLSVFGLEFQPGVLPDPQGVHVRPQQDALPGVLAGDVRRNAPCQLLRRIAQRLQLPLYIARRLRQTRPCFRVLVQRPPVRYDLRFQLFRIL